MLLIFTDLYSRNENSFYITPLKRVEQYFGLAGWRAWQTGRRVRINWKEKRVWIDQDVIDGPHCTYFGNQNFISLLYLSSKCVEQYFGLAGWQTWQTGRSVETKEVLTFNSSFLNKSLTWSFLVVSSPKWGVRSLCGKGTKYYSSLVEHMGLVGVLD